MSATSMTTVCVLDTKTNFSMEVFDYATRFISDNSRQRVSEYTDINAACRSVLGEIMVRKILCNKLQCRNRELMIKRNKWGKPMCATLGQPYFNVSHSDDFVIVGVSEVPVGVDVETIRPDNLKIAKRFFSQQEYLALLDQAEELRLNFFHRIWTLKESLMKNLGKGLRIPLDSFSVVNPDNNIDNTMKYGDKQYYFHQGFIENISVYAVCVETEGEVDMEYITTDELMNDLAYVMG